MLCPSLRLLSFQLFSEEDECTCVSVHLSFVVCFSVSNHPEYYERIKNPMSMLRIKRRLWVSVVGL